MSTEADTGPGVPGNGSPVTGGEALRVAIAVGPASSAVWTMRPPGGGTPVGITVDLAGELAARLGRPLDLVELASSGQIVETADDDVWDVSFVPVDEERRRRVAFGPAYHVGESTFLVRADSPFAKVDDVDVAGARVLGVEGTATLRSARRFLSRATAAGCVTLAEALAEFEAGRCDAVALGKATLMGLLGQMPGTRMTEGNFHVAETAVAVPKGRDALLSAVTSCMEDMLADGTVPDLLERHGLTTLLR